MTGAAGFVGSTLVEHLLRLGWEVRGVDAFTDYYDPMVKHKNLESSKCNSHVELIEADLVESDLHALVDNVDVVFHLAAQPGVRMSWSDDFATYVRTNVLATQLLLDAVRDSRIDRFVYASSSSVYGNSAPVPTPESSDLQPYSPYGVTKLAAEQLCVAYAANFGVPTVSLRYFTVFGPRQRPDMAIHRMIEASLTGSIFRLFGDGSQLRDFTFVDDIVAATVAAASAELAPGEVFNVAGGSSVTVNELVGLVEEATGNPLRVMRQGAEAGDVRATGASIERAMSRLGYRPSVTLAEGLERQVALHRGRISR